MISNPNEETHPVTLSMEEWEALYQPVTTPPGIPVDGFTSTYESIITGNSITYTGMMAQSPEAQKIVQAMNPKFVWTLVGYETLLPGVHFVNREAFYLTAIPWGAEDVEVSLDAELDINKKPHPKIVPVGNVFRIYDIHSHKQAYEALKANGVHITQVWSKEHPVRKRDTFGQGIKIWHFLDSNGKRYGIYANHYSYMEVSPEGQRLDGEMIRSFTREILPHD